MKSGTESTTNEANVCTQLGQQQLSPERTSHRHTSKQVDLGTDLLFCQTFGSH
jgi:hypothetical protein